MNNVYGTSRPANISEKDVEIFYHYAPSRSEDDSNFFGNFKKANGITLSKISGETDMSNTIAVLPGLYHLNLPFNIFNKKGIYTIYIKPKEIITNILDVSTLNTHPDIRGIVINGSAIDNELTEDGSLVGYRVEYFSDGDERSDVFRIITSSNHCEPTAQNSYNNSNTGISYKFTDSASSTIFCTLTPNSATSFKSNDFPYIGKAGQKIALINTKFEPIMMEIEMVDHDIETISTMLEGDQIRNLETNTITTFNNEKGIYHQVACGTITDPSNGKAHDFKINNKRENIDFGVETIRTELDNL